MEHAVAGGELLVLGPRDDLEDLKDEVMADLQNMYSKVDRSGQGVCVQASTLGSLEALLSFLKDSKIPVCGVAIGPVHKKVQYCLLLLRGCFFWCFVILSHHPSRQDVMKASVMLEHKPEYAVLLAFDVEVSKDAKKMAVELGVQIFTADIIYHLFDHCTSYMNKVRYIEP